MRRAEAGNHMPSSTRATRSKCLSSVSPAASAISTAAPRSIRSGVDRRPARGPCDMTVNAPAPALSGTMDVDEFMAFLETRPKGERWDLIEGIAVMMAAPTAVHQRIAHNLCKLLLAALRLAASTCLPTRASPYGHLGSGIFNRNRT